MTTVVAIAVMQIVWLVAQNAAIYLWLPRLVRALVEPLAAEIRRLGESLGARIEAVEARTLPLQEDPYPRGVEWGPTAAPSHARKSP